MIRINNSVVDNPGMFERDKPRVCKLCGLVLKEGEDIICELCEDTQNEGREL